MASILDQKSDVIKLELTKHGRKLLSHGILKPSYYSFFDDSVIYDNLYFNILEDQNNIQDRILDKSLYLTNLNNIVDTLSEPLGASSITSDYAPAWNLQIRRGDMTFLQESSSYYKNVFEFEDIHYKISLGPDKNPQNPIILNDFILIDLQELNIFDESENFEIEVVTFDEITGNNKFYVRDGKKKQLERKLFFTQKKTNIIDDIIYDENELSSKFYDIRIDEHDVGYYFDVQVDEEIDPEFVGLITIDPVQSSLEINPTLVPADGEPLAGTTATPFNTRPLPSRNIDNSGIPEC